MRALCSLLAIRPLADITVIMEIFRRLALSCLILLVREIDVGLILVSLNATQ